MSLSDNDPVKIIRIPLGDLEQADAPSPNLWNNTVKRVKQACDGFAYDISHFNELPGASFGQKATAVCTRGGRAPYLILLITISFLVFFVFIKVGQSFFGKQPRRLLLSGGHYPSIGPTQLSPIESSYRMV